ncbi:MAG: hypothetical protein ABSH48_05760 [Verrucomicrobiota bacterium]|jgi:hypothetical protein
MSHRRQPTAYQKQVRFILVFFGLLLVLAVVGIILLLSRPVGGYHF